MYTMIIFDTSSSNILILNAHVENTVSIIGLDIHNQRFMI